MPLVWPTLAKWNNKHSDFFGRLSLRRATLGGSLIVPSEIARLISKTSPADKSKARAAPLSRSADLLPSDFFVRTA
jgi:hypothetical protein